MAKVHPLGDFADGVLIQPNVSGHVPPLVARETNLSVAMGAPGGDLVTIIYLQLGRGAEVPVPLPEYRPRPNPTGRLDNERPITINVFHETVVNTHDPIIVARLSEHNSRKGVVTICGIAGFFLREEADSNAIAAVMLDRIEHRGRDATGIAWWGLADNDNKLVPISEGVGKPTVWHQKAPVPARQFVKSMAIPTDAKAALMHTRAATQGKPEVNDNNHPIIVSDTIIGVHNGMIRNDDELWPVIGKDLRAAEVDSEVIFAAIYALVQGKQGEKKYGDTLRRLEGGAAVAWMDTREVNRLNIARVKNSPLIIGWTEAGSMFFGSTKVTVEAAAKTGGLTLVDTAECEEGDLFTFGPEGVEMERFVPPTTTWGAGGDWRQNQLKDDKKGKGKGKDKGKDKGTSRSTRSGSSAPNQASAGFLDDSDRQVQSHSDMLRALSAKQMKEGERDHTKLYGRREDNINRFVDAECAKLTAAFTQATIKDAEAKATEDAFDEAEKQGGFLREGDWCSTTLNQERFMAQLVSMPQSFPGGHYVLRVYIPELGSHETCLVRRAIEDFEFVQGIGITDGDMVLS